MKQMTYSIDFREKVLKIKENLPFTEVVGKFEISRAVVFR
jgi:hypothetical protein